MRRSPHGRGLLRQGQEEGRSPERPEDHDEERQAGDPGHLPDLRRQGLPHRRLTLERSRSHSGPPPTAGVLPCPAAALWYDEHDARSGWTRGTRSRPPSDLVVLLKVHSLAPGPRSRTCVPPRRSRTMATRVGINGFGRIGRQSLKAILERAPDVEVVAVNDLVDTPTNALLFKHDSTYGAYPGTVDHTDDALVIDGRTIKVLQVKDPAQLPWGDLGVDLVLESTGLFTDAEKARAHIDAGARKVIISAPAKGEDITIVLCVNEDTYAPEKHTIISNAS